jgi:hypothetical protein
MPHMKEGAQMYGRAIALARCIYEMGCPGPYRM